MENNIDSEKTEKYLTEVFQDDPEKLEILKDSVKNKQFFIDTEGSTNMSSEFVKNMKRIDMIRATPENMVMDMLVSSTNFTNIHFEKDYEINDPIIKKQVENIIAYIGYALVYKNDISYWQNVEVYLKNY